MEPCPNESVVLESSIMTVLKVLQPENAEPAMLVTDAGIVIDDIPLQPENAELPIELTQELESNETEIRSVQPENALEEIPVT
jgi:hypothetical protein